MAQEEQTKWADSGTQQSTTPVWDGYSGEMPPFLDVKEEQKRAGFKVKFLTDKPRKETSNRFNPQDIDFWFDVVYEGKKRTWTINQISLVMELQKQKSLKNKIFEVKLVPIDEEFKKQFPKYKGKVRYRLKYIDTKEPEIKKSSSVDTEQTPEVEVEEFA